MQIHRVCVFTGGRGGAISGHPLIGVGGGVRHFLRLGVMKSPILAVILHHFYSLFSPFFWGESPTSLLIYDKSCLTSHFAARLSKIYKTNPIPM